MANKNTSLLLLLFLVLMANLLVLMAPPVNSAHLPNKHNKCLVYRPEEVAAGHRVKRLANGTDGNIRQMPWMVRLTYNYTSADGQRNLEDFCTGSLVSRRHVLTAAHCGPVSRMPNSSYMITAHFGSANKSAAGLAISVTAANFHKNPQSSSYFDVPNTHIVTLHDTGLLDLGQDLPLGKTVQPICVACLDNQTIPEGQAYIAGWGNINPICHGLAPFWQDSFSYQSVDIHQCLTPGYLGADKVCTQADLAHGIGGGDSGGPLLASANNGSTFLQVAVLGGTNCLASSREDASSKIDKQWFEQITGIKCKKFNVKNNDDDCEDEE